MEGAMAEEQQEFKVTDRRGFDENGTPKPDAGEPVKAEQPPEAAASGAQGRSGDARPPIDFPSYILSCYMQALVLLGETPNPNTNKKEEDVEAARNVIDILTMLEQKTSGNLSGEEGQLLEQVLYELRMKFMAKTNRIKF